MRLEEGDLRRSEKAKVNGDGVMLEAR